MLKHRLRDDTALVRRSLGKRDLEIGQRDPTVDAIDEIEHQPKRFAEAAHGGQGQRANHDRDHRDGDVLEPMSHAPTATRIARSRSASHGAKEGSMVTSRGTARIRGADPNRTISFSVVRITSAPDEFAARITSSISRSEK